MDSLRDFPLLPLPRFFPIPHVVPVVLLPGPREMKEGTEQTEFGEGWTDMGIPCQWCVAFGVGLSQLALEDWRGTPHLLAVAQVYLLPVPQPCPTPSPMLPSLPISTTVEQAVVPYLPHHHSYNIPPPRRHLPASPIHLYDVPVALECRPVKVEWAGAGGWDPGRREWRTRQQSRPQTW